MKFDPQKAFPYPVLRPQSNDYNGPDFQVNVQYSATEGSDTIDFEIDYLLSSEEILDEIGRGRANYVTLISCRDTYFRDVLVASDSKIYKSINKSNLRGEVQVLSYIVAIERINNFKSEDINDEFGDGPFSFNRGEVLAQDEPDIFFVDRDLFKPVTSVFDLVKNESLKETEWKVDLEQDHVQIVVNPKMSLFSIIDGQVSRLNDVLTKG
jgi:hypothetical protein